MNPHYRRLLIPGLLVVLIVVVLISSLTREARGATPTRAGADGGYEVVCTIADPRITESSGLVLSKAHPDLAYTVNDSGNAPVVYAIRVSTGDVVGTTRVSGGSLDDTEALSIDNTGTLWIADIGDNDEERDDIALYALPEPGQGAHSVTARRYPLAYDKGPRNAETLLINPRTNDKYVVSKTLSGGELFPIPRSLKANETNELSKQVGNLPVLVTDGAFTPDGRYAVLRTLGGMQVYDAKSWDLVRSGPLPSQEQGETLAMEAGGDSVLIGSEGESSQLLRVALSVEPAKPDATTPTASPAASPADDLAGDDKEWIPWTIGLAALIALAAGGLVIRRRR